MSKVSPFWNTWYTWKSLRLPWRKNILAGRDLDGNTYWEFADLRHGGTEADAASGRARMRRIVKYPRGTHPGSVMVPPAWHQWLRHVRHDAPSLAEQQQEVARQQRMRVLAAQADARWAGAQRVDGPIQAGELLELAGQTAPETAPATPRDVVEAPAVRARTEASEEAEAKAKAKAEPEPVHVHAQASPQPAPRQQQPPTQTQSPPQTQPPAPSKDSPWKKGGPSEKWQPGAWTPSPPSKR